MASYVELNCHVPSDLVGAEEVQRISLVKGLLLDAKRCGYKGVCLAVTVDAKEGAIIPAPLLSSDMAMTLCKQTGVMPLNRVTVRAKDPEGLKLLRSPTAKLYDVVALQLADPTLLEDPNVTLAEERVSIINMDACTKPKNPVQPEAFALPKKKLPSGVALELSYGLWSSLEPRDVAAEARLLRHCATVFKAHPIIVSCGIAVAHDFKAQLQERCPAGEFMALRKAVDATTLAEVFMGRQGMLQPLANMSRWLLQQKLERPGPQKKPRTSGVDGKKMAGTPAATSRQTPNNLGTKRAAGASSGSNKKATQASSTPGGLPLKKKRV